MAQFTYGKLIEILLVKDNLDDAQLTVVRYHWAIALSPYAAGDTTTVVATTTGRFTVAGAWRTCAWTSPPELQRGTGPRREGWASRRTRMAGNPPKEMSVNWLSDIIVTG